MLHLSKFQTNNSNETNPEFNRTSEAVGSAPRANSTTFTIDGATEDKSGTYTCIATLNDEVMVDVKVVTLIVEGLYLTLIM